MGYSATPLHLRGIPGIAAVGIAAGALFFPAPAVVANSIATSPSTVRTGATVVASGTVPIVGRTAGGDFWIQCTVPSSTPANSYRIGVRCGGTDVGVHAKLRAIVQVTPFASDSPLPGLRGARRSAERARWWVIGGSLVMGIAAFLGVAQWQPKRRRRV